MLRLLMVLGLVAAILPAWDGSIFYSKSFPGSKPEYLEIELQPNGDAQYKENAEDDRPIKFKLRPEEVEAIFSLAAKLNHFSQPLESGLPVAKMGEKTFRWIGKDKTHEAKYNYSQNPDATALQEWFERMTETVNLYYDLDRTVRFEPLGVNRALLLLEASWDRKRILAAGLYMPLLDRVIKNNRYLNMDRDRAAKLKTVFEEALK
jgi:hypothetical protein